MFLPDRCELCDVYYRSRYILDKHKKSDMHKNKMLVTQPEEIEEFPNTITDILSFNSDFYENNVFITQEEELEGLQFTLTDILGYWFSDIYLQTNYSRRTLLANYFCNFKPNAQNDLSKDSWRAQLKVIEIITL